jgi:hypothetical protein
VIVAHPPGYMLNRGDDVTATDADAATDVKAAEPRLISG